MNADRCGQLGDERVAPDQRRHGNREAAHRSPRLRRRAAEQFGVLCRQRRRRLDPQLVAEQPAEVVVDAQRLDRAARRRQRRHQQRPRSLAQRVLLGEGGELGDEPVGVAGGEPLLGPRLRRLDAELLQPCRLGSPLVDIGQLRVRRAVPARQDRVDGRPRGAVHRGAAAQRFDEPVGVELDRRRLQAIAVGRRLDDAGGQVAAEAVEVVLQRRPGVARPPGRPQRLDRRIRRHDVPAAHDQQRQQAPLQRSVGRDVAPVVIEDADRTEHLDAQRLGATGPHPLSP